MGCDIHIHAERRIRERGDGTFTWKEIEGPRRRCWSCQDRETEEIVKGKPCYWCAGVGVKTEEWYEGRDYDLFAVLADVRNSNHVEPIEPPRGIPADADYDVEEAHKKWGLDAHSASWFTVAEILEAALDGPTSTHTAYGGLNALENIEESGHPFGGPNETVMICAGTTGPKVSAEVLRATLTAKRKGVSIQDHEALAPLEWTETRAHIMKDLLRVVNEELLPAVGNPPPEEVRFVFWFDN